MGSCWSKKTTICSSSTTALPDPPDQKVKATPEPPQVPEKIKPQEETLKKEIFVIKHRKSHDSDRKSDEEKPKPDPKCANAQNTPSPSTVSEAADVGSNLMSGGIVVRTSSCSKEEIDAILIQCGRLSRSSSTGKAAASAGGGGRKYSGSKRSYDFDHENGNANNDDEIRDEDVVAGGDDVVHRHRQRHRQSTPSSSGRRRTPSRERDQQTQRPGSIERSGGGGGRRVSRSPGRRSESPITGSSGSTNTTRPGKMVSVPATEKGSNGGGGGADPQPAAGGKRISVKRNVGEAAAAGSRSAASPRTRSPAGRANVRVSNENQQQQQPQPPSLSRSNSRKAEQSPYRRNPLGEIDQNCIGFEVANNKGSQVPIQKPNSENVKTSKITVQVTDGKVSMATNKSGTSWSKEEEQQQQQKMMMEDEGKWLQPNTGNVSMTVVPSGVDSLKPQSITRTRSSRLSRDLDLNPEALLNPSPSSYTARLLEDIQNFHQMGSTPAAISLPPCLTKACSILEAVADLNSTTVSNLSETEQFGKKRYETKEPFVESEVVGSDDLMEPSFHKYVTVSRGGGVGGAGDGDMEEVESSGSNSFVGGGQHWVSSSSWEPNSADSTDCWTSSSRLGEKKRETTIDRQQSGGIGRGRVGSGRGLYSTTTPTLATAST